MVRIASDAETMAEEVLELAVAERMDRGGGDPVGQSSAPRRGACGATPAARGQGGVSARRRGGAIGRQGRTSLNRPAYASGSSSEAVSLPTWLTSLATSFRRSWLLDPVA